jgi:inner membrane protein
MDIFQNAAVMWFVAGFIFFILEFAIPGLILFFFAVGAWIVAILCLFLNIGIDAQLIIFALTTLVTTIFFRNWVKNLIWKKSSTSEIESEFIGKSGKAETPIGPGKKGKIAFKGTSWDATSDEQIEKGEDVVVVGNESILLIVKPKQKLI